MTPQRAQELEAELRRLAAQAEAWAENTISDLTRANERGWQRAYTHAADLVRDAAKGDGE